MRISVIIPAFNEEAYLPATLRNLQRARALLAHEENVEIIVVDNGSADATADVARSFKAMVTNERQRNIAKARNSGAAVCSGNVLVFVDADTLVPETLLQRIATVMADENCVGGSIDTDYQAKKLSVKVYLQIWRIIGRLLGVAQGATQFCRHDAFDSLGGYDERRFMGEDVDFFWRLKRYAKQHSHQVSMINDLKVVPSARRFDQWRLWRTLVWTNPLIVLLFQRKQTWWNGWYRNAPR